jgi:hypothetical protein
MFDSLQVGLNAKQHMSASVQTHGEAVKNYAEVAVGHPSAHEGATEKRCDHGDAFERTGSQGAATLPATSASGKRKPQNQIQRSTSPHN